jgi:hypothetical protein
MISDINMLCKQIGEFTGKVIGQRVLHTVQDGTPKLDMSVSDSGKFKGIIEVTEMWTCYTKIRWYSYGEEQDVIMTKDDSGDETTTATGRRPGKRRITSGKMKYDTALFSRTINSSGEGKKLTSLNNIVGANEYVLAQLGNYNHKLRNRHNKRKNRHDVIWM